MRIGNYVYYHETTATCQYAYPTVLQQKCHTIVNVKCMNVLTTCVCVVPVSNLS